MLLYVNIGIPGEAVCAQIPGAPEAPGFAERATEARRSAAQSASSSSVCAVLSSELSLTAPAAKRRKAGAQPTDALGVPAELPCLSKGGLLCLSFALLLLLLLLGLAFALPFL